MNPRGTSIPMKAFSSLTNRLFLILAGTAAFAVSAAETPSGMPEGFRLLYEQKCDTAGSLNEFAFTDANAWRFSRQEASGPALELFQQSQYAPGVRSPFNIALIADKAFTDFVLEAEVISTAREYPHRDMCLIFGLQSPTNFYYTHIATGPPDPHAHNVFIVNGAPRLAFAKEITEGVAWGTTNQWHKIRLERNAGTGAVKVYFDDLAKPIMTAEDKTFGAGYIGFGAFDDTGKVRNIRVWGRSLEEKKTGFYRRP